MEKTGCKYCEEYYDEEVMLWGICPICHMRITKMVSENIEETKKIFGVKEFNKGGKE